MMTTKQYQVLQMVKFSSMEIGFEADTFILKCIDVPKYNIAYSKVEEEIIYFVKLWLI